VKAFEQRVQQTLRAFSRSITQVHHMGLRTAPQQHQQLVVQITHWTCICCWILDNSMMCLLLDPTHGNDQ
jgi:hypothetical protein